MGVQWILNYPWAVYLGCGLTVLQRPWHFAGTVQGGPSVLMSSSTVFQDRVQSFSELYVATSKYAPAPAKFILVVAVLQTYLGLHIS